MRKKFLLFVIIFLLSCQSKNLDWSLDQKWQTFGIDVSHYQGDIDWYKLANQKKYKIDFVMIRSTMGKDRIDMKFIDNFNGAKQNNILVGAYHYYDPNQNSKLQARNYLKNSFQKHCDFIPILDIEKRSQVQSKKRLLQGIKSWLILIERETGHKPMIYTGLSFYKGYFANNKDFEKYPKWIAAYSDIRTDDSCIIGCHIRQFSESLWIKGLKRNVKVDGNIIFDSLKFKEIIKPAQ